MSDQPFKIDVSQRISRLPPYLFGRINKMKYEKRVAGVDIIDLGMGNPTDPTPDCVVDKLAEAAEKGCPVSRVLNAEITLTKTLK